MDYTCFRCGKDFQAQDKEDKEAYCPACREYIKKIMQEKEAKR